MNHYQEVREMLILDCIRKSKQNPPYPVTGDWLPLAEMLDQMVESGALSIGSNEYEIALIGKKELLIFDSERKAISEPLEQYRDVLVDGSVTDARVSMMAFMVRTIPDGEHLIKAALFAVLWEDIIDTVLSGSAWQKLASNDDMFLAIDALADKDDWKKLGKTEAEASMTGKWLLNP